jgi:hypothetical protein
MDQETITVAIVFGSILAMISIPMLYSLAKKWLDRNDNSYDEQAFDRLAKAFMEHREDTKRRIQNLEAIIADDSSASTSSADQVEKTEETIEIEDQPEHGPPEKDSGNLRNMLNE